MPDDRRATSGPIIGERDAEGFRDVAFSDGFNRSFGVVRARGEGDGRARVRIATGTDHANIGGALHGGFMLACIDQSLFLGLAEIGRLEPGAAVTLTLATQFVSGGRTHAPIDCLVDIISETGRLLFLSGTLEQDDRLVMTFQATLRKLARRADSVPA